MAKASTKPAPKYLIDTHGLRSALTTTKNSVRMAVINAIEAGEMLILKPASNELKENDPAVYADLQTLSPKKYLAITVKVNQTAAALVQAHGGGRLWGYSPPLDRFRALAAARLNKLILITDGKALADCLDIVAKCGLPNGFVAAPSAV